TPVMPALSPAANAGTVRIVVAQMPKNRVCRFIFRLLFICVRKYPRVCRMSTSASNAARRGAASMPASEKSCRHHGYDFCLRPTQLRHAARRDCADQQGSFLWNVATDHSGLIPTNLITLPHFSVSATIRFPKSAGEPARTAPPRSANRAFILGSARAALISVLSLATISAGVFLGAPMPYHWLAS